MSAALPPMAHPLPCPATDLLVNCHNGRGPRNVPPPVRHQHRPRPRRRPRILAHRARPNALAPPGPTGAPRPRPDSCGNSGAASGHTAPTRPRSGLAVDCSWVTLGQGRVASVLPSGRPYPDADGYGQPKRRRSRRAHYQSREARQAGSVRSQAPPSETFTFTLLQASRGRVASVAVDHGVCGRDTTPGRHAFAETIQTKMACAYSRRRRLG